MQYHHGMMDRSMYEEDFDPNSITEDAPDSELPLSRPGRFTGGFPGEFGADQGGMPGMRFGRGMGVPLVDYYLLRVFDFEVVSGKTYQYQVRLLLEDPNNSQMPTLPPSARVLHQVVIDRRRAAKGKKLEHFRKTEWSETSPSVNVPDGRGVFAGLPQLRRTLSLNGRKYDKGPAHAKVMAVVWDNEKNIEVYRPSPVTRGSAVNMKGKKYLAIDPAESRIIELQDEFNLFTNIFVLDLRGGRELPGRQSELLETSEMLLLDSAGRMSLHNEVEDYAILSRYDIDVSQAKEQMKSRGEGAILGVEIGGFDAGRKPGRRADGRTPRRQGGR